jgi:YD repeat-containing protein
MKKTFLIMGIAAVVLITGCKKEPKEYVYLGQLYMAWDHAGQEKIKGRVKEFKQTHFWAAEENGKIVKGKILTIKDRESLAGMGRDMTEEYNESGTVLRSTFFDENGKVLQDVKANAEEKILTVSEYYLNDTLRAKVKYRYDGNNLIEFIAYNPINDTVMMSFKYEYNQNGFIIKTQSYNYKGELQGYTIRTRNENGQVIQTQNYNKDGKLTSQTDYTYNDKGERITQHQQIFTTGQVIDYTFTYEYDKMGNYTAIIFHTDGKPLIYRAREIKYYN